MFSFRLEKIQHISAVFSLSLFFCPSPAVFRKSERMNPTKTSSPTKSTVKHWTCQFLACATKCACLGAGRAPMLRPPKKCGWIRSGVSPVCEMNEFLWTSHMFDQTHHRAERGTNTTQKLDSSMGCKKHLRMKTGKIVSKSSSCRATLNNEYEF